MSRQIYSPRAHAPMRVVCFVSGSGGNLRAAIDLARAMPQLLDISLVVADRSGIPALQVAQANRIPALVYDFATECDILRAPPVTAARLNRYHLAARALHDRIARDIDGFEQRHGSLDIAVLAYRRWIHGDLLAKFTDRMINQHPGDLTVLSHDDPPRRVLVGLNAVEHAITLGHPTTRTSTFLVTDRHDGGELLCQGPPVNLMFSVPSRELARRHENIQKAQSDWPSLQFALRELAVGNFAISTQRHPGGERVIEHLGKPLPYGGVDLRRDDRAHA